MDEPGKNILLVGAGVAGRLLERDIAENTPHQVVGFIDDKRGRGQVVGSISDLPAVVKRFVVDEVVIAIPSADGTLVRRVLLSLLNQRMPVRIVPREAQVLREDDVKYENLRDLGVESWLGRPLVKSGIRRLQRFFEGKNVLVTGGAGSIGSEIVRQLLDFGAKKVVVYDSSEYLCYRLQQELSEAKLSSRRWKIVIGDITQAKKLRRTFERMRPDLVFHAAAYKHVHLMEENIDEAVRVNVLGTKAVVDAAVAAEVPRLVFVSTDKAVNPTSVMGASKRVAEWYVQQHTSTATRFNIVRFGNVINSRGSVLPLWERQIRDHRRVTITDPKMERFFMSIREAAQLVLASATRSSSGAIYVLDMGDLISIKEVAQCLIRSKNLLPNVDVSLVTMGRRQGEKLIEELFDAQERRLMRRTGLPNIWQLQRKQRPQVAADDTIEALQATLETASGQELRRLLKRLFPSMKA